jgi:sarcosine oxidase subunit beta
MRFDDALAGTFNKGDGLVDPNSVVMGYITSALRLGAKAETNVEVLGVNVESGEVRGVITNQGVVSSPVIVNASGPWSGLIGKMAGVDLPITSIRRQMLTTSSIPEIPQDFPFVIDFAQSLYFHREGDGLLTGMSNQNEKPGFYQNVDDDFELLNLEAAIFPLPILERAGLTSHWAGLYEVTPDAHPIFGATPIKGFLVVTGFSGHGFMHGPISGKLMSEYILDGKFISLDVTSLDLARFEENRMIKEYNVV